MVHIISRREFLNDSIKVFGTLTLASLLLNETSLEVFGANNEYYRKAYFYRKINNNIIKCTLCPNGCEIAPGRIGKCKAKENVKGELYTKVYSRPVFIHIDTVEKAPLFHFSPGLKMLSIATAGCNLSCKYCQNWQFALSGPDEVKSFDLNPEGVIRKAKESGCEAISFFYTEPTIFFEYMYDIALLAKKAGLKTVMVTAGYINQRPLEYLCNVIDVFTVGLKGFNENYYQTVVGGRLEPVKQTIKFLKQKNKPFEIVTLIVPTLNDNMTDIKNQSDWLVREVGKDVPLHFSRFVPQYKLRNLPPTPTKTLNQAWRIAQNAGLKYAYIDNLPGHEAQNTVCPKCQKGLIKRVGFKVIENNIKNSKCTSCGTYIKGIW